MKKINVFISTIMSVVIALSAVGFCAYAQTGMHEYNGSAKTMSYTIVDAETGNSYTPSTDFKGSAVVMVFGLVASNAESYVKNQLNAVDNILKNTAPGLVKGVYLDIASSNTASDVMNFKISNGFSNIISSADSGGLNNYYLFNTLKEDNLLIPCVLIADESGAIRYYNTGMTTAHDIKNALISILGDQILSRDYVDYYEDNVESNKYAQTGDYISEDLLNTATVLASNDNEGVSDENLPVVTNLANEITNGLSDDLSKAKAIANWISENIYYDFDYLYGTTSTTSETAIDVINTRTTVCRGYSALMNALCRTAGIPSIRILGYADSSGGWTYENVHGSEKSRANHMWNEVYVNGRWLIIDTTWNSLNRYENGEKITNAPRDNYFDPDIETFSLDHRIVQYFDSVTDSATGFKYNRSYDGVFAAGYTGSLSNGALSLPQTIIGRPVVGITQVSFQAAYLKGTLRSVTLPNTVDVIEYAAFYGNLSLSHINIPYNCNIGSSVFLYCGSSHKPTEIWGFSGSSAEKYVSDNSSSNLKFVAKDCTVLGHTSGVWKTITAAECNSVGQDGKYCEVCNTLLETRETTVSHQFGRWDGDGETQIRKCINCDETQSRANPYYVAPTTVTTTTSASTEATEPKKGDLNSDNIVNTADLLLLKKLIANENWSDEIYHLSDLNADGAVNIIDLIYLKSIIINY